jgi:carbon-monoxide dehydrogenase medium subunit
MRHTAMEDALRGAEATADSARQAAEKIGDDLEPLGDAHGSAGYRRAMAQVVARRAVCQAMVKGDAPRG